MLHDYLISTMRRINEIIIHCTDTPAGREVSVDDIRNWHLKRGFDDIGYHFVIGLDGTIHVGRSLDKIGAHCKGHNRNSIGICYVGGRSVDMKHFADTRTSQQDISLAKLIISLLKKYPITSIVGHNKYAKKACPCFYAELEYKHLIPINHDKEM